MVRKLFMRGGCCVAILAVLLAAISYLPRTGLRLMYAWHTSLATEPFWPGGLNLRNVSGVPSLVYASDAAINKWKTGNFTHRPEDAWVVSSPKSGTTLTQVIVMSLFNRTMWATASPDLIAACPTYERRDLLETDSFKSPRCLKTHWPAQDHMTSPGRGRVIWVSRHVADVARSLWPFWNQLRVDMETEEPLTIEEFERAFLAGNIPFGDWFTHYASWWKLRDDPNVYMLRYEDLKADRRGAIKGVADFLGGDAPNYVDNAFDASDFQQMKFTENRRWIRWLAIQLGTLSNSRLRTGQTGEGKVSFSPEFLEGLERKYKEILEPLGVPRDYVF